MVFNSFQFLIFFLPPVLIVYFLLGRSRPDYAASWFALASLVFYGWWGPRNIPVIAVSIAFNYAVGLLLSGTRPGTNAKSRRAFLAVGISGDLCALFYFKYSSFFIETIDHVFGLGIEWHVTLPLGISFFTFTQIAFLVDTYRNIASEFNPIHYTLFVSYYPHLVAGPILHHKSLMSQFRRPEIYRPSATSFAIGICFFAMGLFKKTVIADGLSPQVAPLFDSTVIGPPATVAWLAAVAYGLQIYFDFSGYSDMAIGLSRLVGVHIPINFNSPYKSLSVIDFWRRWHISLSRFLRDYLYFSLGGNRRGTIRRFTNLMITMLLGGLWHGAAWTFVIWGTLHGAYLVVNHGWRALWQRLAWNFALPNKMATSLSFLLTFAAIAVAWVFFRAPNLSTAMEIIRGMSGLNGMGGLGIDSQVFGPFGAKLGILVPIIGGRDTTHASAILMLECVGLTFACLILPNSQQIMRLYMPSGERETSGDDASSVRLLWHPNWRWSIAITALLIGGLVFINRASEFIYWQF